MYRVQLAMVLVAASLCCGQGVPARAEESMNTARTLIRAGHVLDVHSGKETPDQTLIVTNGLISAIAATSATLKSPADQEIDLRNMWVLKDTPMWTLETPLMRV